MRNYPVAWVLMTALPPTIGHGGLIDYAHRLISSMMPGDAYGLVEVLLCVQPDEPMIPERAKALDEYAQRYGWTDTGVYARRVRINLIHRYLPQEPGDGGISETDFWNMWRDIMMEHGFQPGDLIITSESYGAQLAQAVGGKHFPYDMDRGIRPSKATRVREDTLDNFDMILPEFQQRLRKTVTLFGAESVGKSTLTRAFSNDQRILTVPEWARGYLESEVGSPVTREQMIDIWAGQAALQRSSQDAAQAAGRAFVIQDTDLFSTVGYWKLHHGDADLGPVPGKLILDAIGLQSDLYIVLGSQIPFEPDPLRYGSDQRESSDEFWIDLCKQYDLNWVYITATEIAIRRHQVFAELRNLFGNPLDYQRRGAEYW